MSKIKLSEAYEIVLGIELELIDVFASIIHKREAENALKLFTLKDLKNKIYQAEKFSGIDNLRNQIHLLVLEENYYAPQQATFYYKDSIKQEQKDENFELYSQVVSDLELLKDKIKEISEKIYIKAN